MNPKQFRRIVTRLLGGSLPIAALLGGHLACNNCYPAGTSSNIAHLELPPLIVDGGIADAARSAGSDGGLPTDAGLADGGMGQDGGPVDDVVARCLDLCTTYATTQKLTLIGSTPNTDANLSGTFCDCDFGLVHYDAQCIPPGATYGRRPAGFVPNTATDATALGQFFAHAAQCEAASVAAFLILAQELQAHRAPAFLVKAARRAAADEFRHAQLTGALVARFGGRASWPKVPAREVRSLPEVALDNEVEGCVGEAYAAFVAAWQSRAATDPWIRVAMSLIAPDEVRHAELSFAISAWVRCRLGRREQLCLDEARHTALHQLQETIEADPLPLLGFFAGLPTAATSQNFLATASH